MRSLLFVPGNSEKKLAKGFASVADVIIVDLEDSVAAQDKETARTIAADFIGQNRGNAKAAIYVRVNDLATGLTDADLAVVIKARPDGIMLPKSNGQRDIENLAARLRVAEAQSGVADGATRIVAIMTETAAGVLGAGTYSEPLSRLAGLTWGAEDLSAAIGAHSARDEAGNYTHLFQLARSMTLLAAASAGVEPIDTVFPNFRDAAGFERECREALRDGFTGKMAIHPDQVPIINEVFTPSEESLRQARAVVQTFAEAGNPGVVAIGGKMYDRPHLRLAERLLTRAATLKP
jgi:citrate lyase subunit beta/citryl-CoA lyase